MVLVEKLGQVSVRQLLRDFSEDDYIRQQVFSREAVRALCTANSIRRGRRLYKNVVVIDLEGLSREHVSRQFEQLMGRVNSLFANHYPETIFKVFVINAPLVFKLAWAIARRFLHPVTVSKFEIVGRAWQKTLDDAGVVLDGGAIPAMLRGWAAEAREAIDEFGIDILSKGFVPEADRLAIFSEGA